MAAGLAALAGCCAGQGDIDRTQPDKIPKAMFFAADGTTPKVFYYRQTYVEVPVTSGWTFEGMMGNLDKVRFDIQENYLYGYRSYDYAPGANNAFNGGGNNQDAPCLSSRSRRTSTSSASTTPGTGEQTNVISENTTDRPWYERDYMRVDWSQNLAVESGDTNSPMAAWLFRRRARPDSDHVSETERRPRQSRPADHLAVVFRRDDARDPHARLQGLPHAVPPGLDDGAWWDCGPAELKVRHSFMEVKPSTYVPLSYPDRPNRCWAPTGSRSGSPTARSPARSRSSRRPQRRRLQQRQRR